MGKLEVWIYYWNKLVGVNQGSSFSGLGMLAPLVPDAVRSDPDD